MSKKKKGKKKTVKFTRKDGTKVVFQIRDPSCVTGVRG